MMLEDLKAMTSQGESEHLEFKATTILRGFGLLRDGLLFQAAVALFGNAEQLQVLYPQFSLRLARFRGLDRLAPFEDKRRYWGHAFRLLRRAESFLMDHTPIASRVLPQMEREDLPAYLPAVTREGLANALCHRDYTQASDCLSVAMYDDRLEIVNPGGLHFGLTSESLSTPPESRPWNPLIAGVFYRAGIIESWGSGTTRMLEACQDQGRPSPSWRNEICGLRLVLTAPQVTPEVTPEVVRVLRYSQAPVTRQELQALLGLKDPDHVREAYLRPALEAGLLIMTIPGKPNSRLQQYHMTPKGAAILETIPKPGPGQAPPRESKS
jgi:ATP-dependent DNA helicase RecG